MVMFEGDIVVFFWMVMVLFYLDFYVEFYGELLGQDICYEEMLQQDVVYGFLYVLFDGYYGWYWCNENEGFVMVEIEFIGFFLVFKEWCVF